MLVSHLLCSSEALLASPTSSLPTNKEKLELILIFCFVFLESLNIKQDSRIGNGCDGFLPPKVDRKFLFAWWTFFSSFEKLLVSHVPHAMLRRVSLSLLHLFKKQFYEKKNYLASTLSPLTIVDTSQTGLKMFFWVFFCQKLRNWDIFQQVVVLSSYFEEMEY